MKKLLLFAAVAGLGLVSASPPDRAPASAPRDGAHEARRDYPPCTRQVRDSCIQRERRARGAAVARRAPARVARAHAGGGRPHAQRVRRAGERG